MKTYEVKIFKNGVHVDTQTVQAQDKWKAKTAAMVKAMKEDGLRFRGELAAYEVREIDNAK